MVSSCRRRPSRRTAIVGRAAVAGHDPGQARCTALEASGTCLACLDAMPRPTTFRTTLARRLAAMVLLLVAAPALAADLAAPQRLEAFGPDEGLPQSTVNALAGDDQGFLWVATRTALPACWPPLPVLAAQAPGRPGPASSSTTRWHSSLAPQGSGSAPTTPASRSSTCDLGARPLHPRRRAVQRPHQIDPGGPRWRRMDRDGRWTRPRRHCTAPRAQAGGRRDRRRGSTDAGRRTALGRDCRLWHASPRR